MTADVKPQLAYDLLMKNAEDSVDQTYTDRDTIIYNLGIGMGAEAIENHASLRYVLEDGLHTFPSMVSVLAPARDWYYDPRYGMDLTMMVHGEEEFQILSSLPIAGKIRGRNKIAGIWDRGPGKGAIMRVAKTLVDEANREIAICHSTIMLRGNGGYGGTTEGMPKAASTPEREPDGAIDMMTRPEQALIYRLSGDINPLHAVPDFAKQAGFPGPILHGLCSFGVAARGIVSALCGGNSDNLRRFSLRFSSPVYPGETIRVEYWKLEKGEIAFRTRIVARDVIVHTGGRASIAS